MIAYFVYNLDSYSGAAQQALLLSKNIRKDILIFNHNNKSFKMHDKIKSIQIIDLPKSRFAQLLIIFYYTLIKDIKIYHFHGFFKFNLLLGYILQRKMIIKTTLLGSDDLESIKNSKYGKIKLFLISKVYKNIVLSKKLKEINSKYIDSSKIELIPNGVLLAENCPTLEEKENAFCFVGFVCERKRTYDSIKYFIDNYSKDISSKMYIVGPYKNMQNNQEFSNEYVNKCFELIKINDLETRVVFTDRISKEKTQDIFRKSKALLFFSDKEGMPNVVLEAMANNCVPVVSELDGVMKEIFTNEEEGFIINNNEMVTVQKINNLLKSKMPYNRIQKSFSIEKISNKYEKLYEQI